MRMPFQDYVELLYRAYLEDEEILQRLREKLQDDGYLKRLDGDPEFQDWNQVNPRDIDPRKRSRSSRKRSRRRSREVECSRNGKKSMQYRWT